MRCTSPRTVGFLSDGKTICWSQKNRSKEYATFQLPCGKCLDCRLEYARQWAIRCVHEAQMHEKSCFVTLTYSDENLKSPKLIYSDFQKFMKRLRRLQNEPIGCFVTGEYGDQTKRPHYHALLFGYRPNDSEHKYTTERGDRVYSSPTLSRTWSLGICEFGDITFHSAGYCARYAAKKLGHGRDGEHEYEPISKKSSKHAIGKKWLEKFWPDVFSYGYLVLPNGQKTAIPRYYEKWFRENHPEKFRAYLEKIKSKSIQHASAEALKRKELFDLTNANRLAEGKLTFIPSEDEQRRKITALNHKKLQSYLKL